MVVNKLASRTRWNFEIPEFYKIFKHPAETKNGTRRDEFIQKSKSNCTHFIPTILVIDVSKTDTRRDGTPFSEPFGTYLSRDEDPILS